MNKMSFTLSLSSLYLGIIAIYLVIDFGRDVMFMNYIAVAVGVIAFLFSYQGKVVDKPTKQVVLTVCGYIVFSLLSIFMSNVSSYVGTTKGRLIASCCVMLHTFLMMAICKDRTEKTFERLLYFIMAGMLVQTFITYSFSDLMDGLAGEERLGKELNGVNIFGMTMGFMAIFAVYKAMVQTRHRFFHILLAFVLAAISFTSGSRKAILGVIVGILLLVLFLQQGNQLSALLKGLLAVAVVIYLLSVLEVTEGVFARFSSLWTDVDEKTAFSDDIRKDMIQEALNGWMRKPLFGNGFNTFTATSAFRGTYSHNNFAELLYNCGIVGVILYYAPKFVILGLFIRDKRYTKKQFSAFFLSVLVLLLSFDMACVSYYVMDMNYLWWFAGAYIIGQVWQEQTSQAPAI